MELKKFHTYWLILISFVYSCSAGTEIVSKAARERVAYYLQMLKQHFSGMYP